MKSRMFWILWFIGILLSSITISCATTKNSSMVIEDNFDRDISCNQYFSTWKSHFQKRQSLYWDLSVIYDFFVFYSSTKKSCIVAFSDWNDFDKTGMDEYDIFDYDIYDMFNWKRIFHCSPYFWFETYDTNQCNYKRGKEIELLKKGV